MIWELQNFPSAKSMYYAEKKTLPVGKGKGKVFPLQARLWPKGWVEL